METYSFILEACLSVAGVIIAVIQLIGELRVRNEEKKELKNREEEKKCIGKILIDVQKAEIPINELAKSYTSTMEKLQKGCNNPKEPYDTINNFINEFEEAACKLAEGSLKNLYDVLLRNEERFPMAYGYGRYISELRYLRDIDRVRRDLRLKGYDANLSNYANLVQKIVTERNGQLDPASALQLGMYVEKIDLAVRDVVLNYLHTAQAVIYELKQKYDERNQ